MNQNKLICTDLDGTLLNDDGDVSLKDIEALKIMLDKGYIVYLVTGRPEYFAQAIAQDIDSRIKVISYNGAVYEIDNHKKIKCFEKENIEEILTVLNKFNFRSYFKSENTVYTNDKDNKFDYSEFGVSTVFSLDRIMDVDIIKIIVLEEVSREYEFEELIEILEIDYNVSHYVKKGFELSIRTVSKGNAVKDIINYYGIFKENVYVFGDDINDLSMFDVASHPIASDNASGFVKMHAKYVSTDNNNSSIAHGLKHLGLMD